MFYNWKIALLDKRFRNRFLISMFMLLLLLISFASLLAYIETRQTRIFYDPILNFIKPRDVSNFIFFVTYLSALIALVYAFLSPYKFLHLIQMYGLLTLFRILVLFILPLEPPAAIIPLHDEIIKHSFNSDGESLKELFLSGHATVLFLFYFFSVNKILKYLFLISAISVSIGVVIQHTYNSYDIVTAPIFAYIAYKLVIKFSKHYTKETKNSNLES